MNDLITIANEQLSPLEYAGQRVVTFAMIDRLHQRPEGTAKRNFNTNQDKFIEGADYFKLSTKGIRTWSHGGIFPLRSAHGTLLTQSGYLMVVKSLTDDLAWQVQRELVSNYFAVRRPMVDPDLEAMLADPAILTDVKNYVCYRLRLKAEIDETVDSLNAKIREYNAQAAIVGGTNRNPLIPPVRSVFVPRLTGPGHKNPVGRPPLPVDMLKCTCGAGNKPLTEHRSKCYRKKKIAERDRRYRRRLEQMHGDTDRFQG